ncbi:MAG: hypothetical protein HY709_08380 [Candidatus Latescibacteria bacterium]|nr:hypothetical protein [Candidatus Latescibacterota bacterium]
MALQPSSMTAAAAKAKAIASLWTFPSVIFSAVLIAWAAEAGQFLISQGFALAILAWLQTLPEFVVEGIIAWEQNVPLMAANFTGAIRLLVGFGWPMIYFTTVIFQRPPRWQDRFVRVSLEGEHAIGILALLPPVLYFVIVVLKGTLSLFDAFILLTMYGTYLWLVQKVPPKEVETIEDLSTVPRHILGLRPWLRNLSIIGLFAIGGTTLFFLAEPFVHSMLGLAMILGVSEFVFVQWVAPFLSEFPEKVSAFYWARTVKKAPMAIMNMVSSSVNEWTVLASVLPIVYSISRGEPSTVHFDTHQRIEILLTVVQSLLGFLLLANLEFRWHEAAGLFILWAVQFIMPDIREEIIFVYGAWAAIELLRGTLGRRKLRVFGEVAMIWRTHVRKR